jgi:hypothetical protein
MVQRIRLSFSGLVPNNYVLYVRNVADNSCVSQSVSSTKIDPLPALPVVPTVDLLCNLLAVYKQER